jgi:hypothetical protein
MILKAQSAIQYLITYGWAFLIIAIALVAFVALGITKPSAFISDSCITQGEFSCTISSMATNGLITINIVQDTASPILIIGAGCNATQPVALTETNLQLHLNIAGNATVAVQCYSGGVQFTGKIGGAYSGELSLEYVDEDTSLPHYLSSKITAKVNAQS